MQTWHKIQQLTLNEWRLLILAVVLLPLSHLGLLLFGFRRLCVLLGYREIVHSSADDLPTASVNRQSLLRAQQVNRLVTIAATYGPFPATCLRHSLVLWWLLQRAEIPSRIRIGVARDNMNFAAHAWVEYSGIRLDGATGQGEHAAHWQPLL